MCDEQVPFGRRRTASAPGRSQALRCRLALCLAYPLVMATAVAGEVAWLEAVLLPLAAGVLMAPMLLRGQRAAWLILGAVIVLAAVVRSQAWLGMWPPAVITGAAAAWFSASLRPASVPLIERFAHAVRHSCALEAPGDEPLRWMRAWTGVWALVLGAIAVALAWTAASGQITAWVYLSYALPAIMAVLLCGEYALRRVFLPQHARMSLVGFLAALLAIDWGDLPR